MMLHSLATKVRRNTLCYTYSAAKWWPCWVFGHCCCSADRMVLTWPAPHSHATGTEKACTVKLVFIYSGAHNLAYLNQQQLKDFLKSPGTSNKNRVTFKNEKTSSGHIYLQSLSFHELILNTESPFALSKRPCQLGVARLVPRTTTTTCSSTLVPYINKLLQRNDQHPGN